MQYLTYLRSSLYLITNWLFSTLQVSCNSSSNFVCFKYFTYPSYGVAVVIHVVIFHLLLILADPCIDEVGLILILIVVNMYASLTANALCEYYPLLVSNYVLCFSVITASFHLTYFCICSLRLIILFCISMVLLKNFLWE